MRLLLDDKQVIIGFVKIGALDGTIEYNGPIPDDFYEKFKPSFYMLKNGAIIDNPNYVEPESPAIGPSAIEQQVAALGYQQMQDNQDKQTLVKQNAQIAYQVMQIQQQLGGQKV
jgi:Protein of unknown function (DUF2977).